MDKSLIKARIISFGYEAGTLIAVAIVGALASPEMRELIGTHAGSGFFGTVAMLVLMEVVKHLRNLKVIKNSELGATLNGIKKPVILI